MRKYVFITMTICSIGGAEQYIYNKTNYLQDKGYSVFVFSSFDEDVLVKPLEKYKKYCIPNLMYPISCFRKEEINRVIDKIIKQVVVQKDDIFYIEATSLYAAEWGELLSERLNCECIVINLQEKHEYSVDEIEFLRFKYLQNELYGITESSVQLMLADTSIPISSKYQIHAMCNNVVDDVPYQDNSRLNPAAKYTLGTIGRLEKECMDHIIKSYVEFGRECYPDVVNIVLIGGSKQTKVVKNIKKIFSEQKNINLIITGFIYPISRELLKKIDLFVSTAGSANVSYMENRPTIKVNPLSGLPIGVYGSIEYPIGDMYEQIDEISLVDLMKSVLSSKISIKYNNSYEYRTYKIKMYNEFDRQLRFFSQSDITYYNVNSISNNSRKYMVYRIVGKVLGGTNLHKLLNVVRHLIQ